MIKKLLIANRGEIAVRIAAACRELGIRTVAVYSDADQRSLHVRTADEAVAIGPAPSAASYLNVAALIGAARSTAADAIHPGYGFLSQSAAFAAACEEAGITFVGPSSRAMALMGSKIEARRLMQQTGVPVVPGETPHDQSDAGILAAVDRVGLPALIKASAGGGGKGMRIVRDRSGVADAVAAARREAIAAFGDGTLYIERLIERPRHIEVQIVGDRDGRAIHLFERECSAQRRHQKVIEESPAPNLQPALRDKLTDAAVRAASAVSYRNAGTVEFLVDPRDHGFYFLEMNTRLQVEHGVTELVAGVDLVRAQLVVSSGEALSWTPSSITPRGHAIEARIYAEDPSNGFLPQAGRLLLYREPKMPGVRVDAGVVEGDEVTVHYDPLLAKVMAWAENREAAIARLMAALRRYPVLGVRTNVSFLLGILDHPDFRAGTIDTGFLDRELSRLAEPPSELPPVVRAAIGAHHATASTRPASAGLDPWDGLR
jgi:acetyl-CoA carboxylase biotin carboxylase subunit